MLTDMSTYVYAIRFGDYVKIGYSSDPTSRMRQLASRSDSTLRPDHNSQPQPIMAVPGDRRTEHMLHLAFDAERHIGEYYHYRGAVRDWCERLLEESANAYGFSPPRVEPPETKYVFVHCGRPHSDKDPESLELPGEILTSDVGQQWVGTPVDF